MLRLNDNVPPGRKTKNRLQQTLRCTITGISHLAKKLRKYNSKTKVLRDISKQYIAKTGTHETPVQFSKHYGDDTFN